MKQTAKEKAIREAYGDIWSFFKDKVDGNGWIKDRDFWGRWPENMDKINWECTDHDDEYYDKRRPLSLKGLENNRGWIIIESESDLPDASDRETHYFVSKDKVVNPIPYHASNVARFYKLGIITHYQQIKKPQPPIY